jgi:hypothetical protein
VEAGYLCPWLHCLFISLCETYIRVHRVNQHFFLSTSFLPNDLSRVIFFLKGLLFFFKLEIYWRNNGFFHPKGIHFFHSIEYQGLKILFETSMRIRVKNFFSFLSIPISNTKQIIRTELPRYTYSFLPGPALSTLPPFWPPRAWRDPPFFG